MTYHVATARRGLGQGSVVVTAPPAGGAPKTTDRTTSGGQTVVGIDTAREPSRMPTMPAGWNPFIALAVLRYPQTELAALDAYDLTGTLKFPNSYLMIQAQRELSGQCDEVLKKLFLIDMYEKARAGIRALLAYSPAPNEQKPWYDAAQGWMQIWCRATSIQGGTFQSAMSVSRLLNTPFSNEAPWPEKSDGQTLSRQISTVQLSGVATATVVGTPYDLFGFTSQYPVADGRENANLAWPRPGPDEQYFGMPLWATFILSKYEGDLNKWMKVNGHDPNVVIYNCGQRTPFGLNRGNLTGQKASPRDRPDKINYADCMSSGDVTWHWTDVFKSAFKAVRQQRRLPGGNDQEMLDYAMGTRADDDHGDLWESTSDYPIDVYVGVIDACTSFHNTQNPYDIFYQAIRNYSSNPLAKIASDMWTQIGCANAVYWQTGTAATGKMMCAAIRPRMQEMADLEFMPLLARSMQQYALFLQQPENIALAGASAGQITAAANAAAQAGVETAAQVGEAIGAGIMVFGGIGTVIGGIVAGLSALLGFLGSLITTQAYAPPPLWYRTLDHCGGQELAAAGVAAITQWIQKQKLMARQLTSTIAAQAEAFRNGVQGNGETGSMKTWKLAAWTGGGIFATAFVALVVRKKRERRAAPVAKNWRRSRARRSA